MTFAAEVMNELKIWFTCHLGMLVLGSESGKQDIWLNSKVACYTYHIPTLNI
jgi:hypothetical protein